MQRMILVILLVVAVLTSLAKSMPYHRRDADEMLADISDIKADWNPEEYSNDSLQDDQTGVPKIDNSEANSERRKKMVSLSITNPMDVLRQRYILEITRKHQRQQEKQAQANREILNGIGKRSLRRLGMIYPSIQTRNSRMLRHPIGQVSSNNPNWSRMERLDWYDVENSEDRNNEADQLNNMETNELHLL